MTLVVFTVMLMLVCLPYLYSDAWCHSKGRQPAGVCTCPGGLPEEVSIMAFHTDLILGISIN